MAKQTAVPKKLKKFEKKYPEVWAAFQALGAACHEKGGPLNEKTRRLVKLGIAIGSQHQGAVHSAARQALESGAKKEEILQAAVLAITTVGWPAAYAAMTWIEEEIGG